MDARAEREAEENRKRLLEATATTLLLLRRRRNRVVRVGLQRELSPARIAETLKDTLRTGLLEAREVARSSGLRSLERELASVGKELGVRAETREIVRDVYRAVSQSTSYATQWLRAAKTSIEEASARTNHALERTATTEAVDAFNTAKATALEGIEAPLLGRRWDAKLDARVCDFCAGLDGTIVAAGQAFPDGEPPIHVNCRCSWTLVELSPFVRWAA